MANFDFDSSADGEWDDSWETIWNEGDWERYLKSEESHVADYQRLYRAHLQDSNRLDEVAKLMGWEPKSERSHNQDAASDSSTSESPETQPYTIHRHPLYIASKALHRWLSENWKRQANVHSDRISNYSAMALQEAIFKSEEYGVLAVTALDLADFSLAIAYVKRGYTHLNTLLFRLSLVDTAGRDSLNDFVKQAKTRVFDIREIWLRVAADCRAASSSRFDEE